MPGWPRRSCQRTASAAPRRWCCRPAFRTASRSRIRSPAGAPRPGLPIIGDIELLALACKARALRRHHRHQRQIDHHRADRPHPKEAGRIVAVGGNLGFPALLLEALGAERNLRAGVELLSARTHQQPGARRRGAVERHARPSRPPWRHGGLCRGEEARLPQPDIRAQRAVIGVDDEICRGILPRSNPPDGRRRCRSRPRPRPRAASMSRAAS